MNRQILMWYCAEQTTMRVGQHRGIRLTETLPTDHPSRAYVRFDSGITTWQDGNVAYMMAGLSPSMPCGREQIARS